MKNICFLISDLNNSGGTERVTSLIANKLSSTAYNISILSLNNGSRPFYELNNNIKIHSLYSKKISFKKNFFGTAFKIRAFVKKYNVDTLVVVDSISCVFTVPALYGLKINHICWEHFNFNVDLGVVYRRFGRKLAALNCDYVVTLTDRDRELWQNGLRHIKAKIVPIANPNPYENIGHKPSLNFKTVLSMGRLTDQKGFDLLIEAWRLVCVINKDWVLRIVGDGEDKEKLKKQARQLGIDDRIEFISATQNVQYYYRTSSIYCLSSRYEGLPMVLLEAQAFGLPVVAFNCDTGPSEILNDKENGWLVEDGNTKALANQLLSCINMKNTTYINSIEYSILSVKRFSVQNIINDWEDIL